MISTNCKFCGRSEVRNETFKEFCSRSCYQRYRNGQPERAKHNKRTRLAYREFNPKQAILSRAKSGAKLRGVECALEIKDIPDIPKFCPVFKWIKLDYRVGKDGRGTINDSAPSLDRINNTLGYVPGNVRIISWRANELKKNGTPEELKAIGLDAARQIKKRPSVQQNACNPTGV